MSEKDKLQEISERSLYSADVMPVAIDYCFRIFSRHICGESILEMGPAEGVMTDRLASLGLKLALVEGSALFCDQLRSRFPEALVQHALFEEFNPMLRYDNIVLGHVLEHVEDPVDVLRRCSEWLAHSGRILAAVPNARSLHRQAAVVMGLLPQENALNDLDRHHGHRRVFNPEEFRACFTQAGLRVDHFGGYWLKPLSNGQLAKQWTPSMLEAYMALGERYPDIAAEMYIVASVKD